MILPRCDDDSCAFSPQLRSPLATYSMPSRSNAMRAPKLASDGPWPQQRPFCVDIAELYQSLATKMSTTSVSSPPPSKRPRATARDDNLSSWASGFEYEK